VWRTRLNSSGRSAWGVCPAPSITVSRGTLDSANAPAAAWATGKAGHLHPDELNRTSTRSRVAGAFADRAFTADRDRRRRDTPPRPKRPEEFNRVLHTFLDS